MPLVRFVEHPVNIRAEPLRHARRLVRDTCRDIERSARRIAPVNHSPYRRPGPHLNQSIRSRVPSGVLGRGVTGTVGSELNHALVAHVGARPHVIRPRNPESFLKFYWPKLGRWVWLPSVNHPGHSGNAYLTLPLSFHGAQRGFIVTIFPVPR